MGQMGDRTNPRLTALTLLLAAALGLPGCSGERDATPEEAVRAKLAASLPDGWSVGAPAEAGVEAGDAALVAYRQAATPLRARVGGEGGEGRVYFPIHFTDPVDPDTYRDAMQASEKLQRQHEQVDKSVANVPRNADGTFEPRDQWERADVTRYREAKAALPPYQPLPTQHHRGIGVRVEDTRGRLVPEDRAVAQEMNRAYAALTGALTPYQP